MAAALVQLPGGVEDAVSVFIDKKCLTRGKSTLVVTSRPRYIGTAPHMYAATLERGSTKTPVLMKIRQLEDYRPAEHEQELQRLNERTDREVQALRVATSAELLPGDGLLDSWTCESIRLTYHKP